MPKSKSKPKPKTNSKSTPKTNSKSESHSPTRKTSAREPRVALVCDWLTNVGGAEKVILKIHQLFPHAPIYTSKYDPKGIDWFKDADVRTGWLQHFPSKLRRILGPLRQIYFSHLDLSDYDLVISITGAEAKSVKAKNGVHISYCHVPTQYYWQMYDDYIKNPGFGVLNPIVRLFFRLLVIPLRHADLKAAQSPDFYVTISEYAKEQIKKYYGRDSVVIHPPVELKDFKVKKRQPRIRLKDGYDLSDAYVVTSRQVNWKRVDLAVRAGFLSQRHILIIGEGPEHRQLVKMAKGSDLIQFLPLMRKEELARYLSQARGFLFPSLEPFGIAPVEALAAGCPVVAYGQGGATDYIQDGKNGVLFDEQTPMSLAEGIIALEKLRLNRKQVSESVSDFGEARFDRELLKYIAECQREFGLDEIELPDAPEEQPEKKDQPEEKSTQAKKPAKEPVAEPQKPAKEPVTKPKKASPNKPKEQGTTKSASKSENTTAAKPASKPKFPIIHEDYARTQELLAKAEEAKKSAKPPFPKIGR